MLQRLAGDVQREVGRVHHTAHEAEVVGQQFLALVHDEHVGAVQGKPALEVLRVHVPRRAARHEHEGVVVQRALGVHRDGAGRVFEVMEVGLIELVVLFLRNLALLPLPDRNHGVDGLHLGVAFPLGRGRFLALRRLRGLHLAALGDFHLDGVAHVVAVALDELAQAVLAGEGAELLVVGVVLQVHDDVGAVLRAFGRLDVIAVDAVGFPGPGLVRPDGTGHHAYLLAHHEGGVEAHAELADDVHVGEVVEPLGLAGLALGGGLGLGGLELEGVGMGDGAEVAVELVLGHADAIVGHGDGALVAVEAHHDGQVVAAHGHRRVGEAAEVELVHGVGGVGDKLAQENLAVGVDGVDHEVEQLLALSLELSHR